MENIKAILPSILSSGLLSESISSLAHALGYKSRATLYRIMDGSASTKAINEFCNKLEATLFLSEDTLYNIFTAIENTGKLKRLLKAEPKDLTNAAFEVLKAFIMHDYAVFSKDFRKEGLLGLQQLEHADSEAFFLMLAFYYFKSLNVNFYNSGETHTERCAQIIEPLGEQLIELYPANGIAAAAVYTYKSSLFDSEAPVLWNCITTLASILQMYGTPDISRIVAKDMFLVPFLSNRTYLKSDNRSDLMLMRAIQHNIPGSGFYDIFKINPDSGKVRSIGVITFLSDEIFSYRDKETGDTHLGVFELEDGYLGFIWANNMDSPSWMSKHWRIQTSETSLSLREMDKRLSDNILNEAAMLADGHKLLTNKIIVNVNMSRTGVRLSMTDGSIYKITYKAAPFLEYILPTNDVILGQRLSDGEIFVSWPQLMHCIPLRLFKQIRPPQTMIIE